MIDLASEQLISLADARQRLPGTKPGTKISAATFARWVRAGKLESIRLGGRRFTSVEALQRFAQQGAKQYPSPAQAPATANAAFLRIKKRLSRFET
jgi:hypothetical protein